MSKKGSCLGYLVFVVLVIFLYFSFKESDLVNEEINQNIFVIEKGEGLKEVSERLEQEGLVGSKKLFQLYTFFSNARKNILPGEYNLESGTSFKNLVNILTSQSLASEIEVTILESWTNREIGVALENKGLVTQAEFSEALAEIGQQKSDWLKEFNFLSEVLDDKVLSVIGKDPHQILQGYLFPDTYRFYKETTAQAIIKKMLNNFDQKIDNEMRLKFQESGRTIHEIVTLASIVEKEASLDQDRRLIADLFWDRLSINWAMQSDATINYVLSTSNLQPTFEDTRALSPYNTYLHPGLPPGPINNPSLSSIRATIYPIENDYCCFLTNHEGKNIFSRTIEEHYRNKEIYLK